MTKRLALLLVFSALGTGPLCAQTIYPIDRAEILAGSRFDLKIEYPAAADNDLSVTINGEVASKFTGVEARFARNEDGSTRSAIWYRDVHLDKPGAYAVTAKAGESSKTVNWTVYDTPARQAKNVILFIGDGLSMAHRTAARMLSKGIVEGRYGGELAIDDMPQMALVSTAGTDSIITDSANSMSAYTTGHKTCVNALGVYCAANELPFAHPRVETLTSLVQRQNKMAVGIVTNAEIEDATPAAMFAHTRRRSEKSAIVSMMFDAKPDVILGGGSDYFSPRELGGKRNDNQEFIPKFKADGYAFSSTAAELKTVSAKQETRRLLGLFNGGDIDGALDLKYLKKGTVAKFPDQPDLVEQTQAALDVLSRGENGFLLMVESARIDKYSHALDWERAVYDTIMLDQAVALAKTFAAKRNDTLIVVVADHGHPVSIVGSYDDGESDKPPREKLGIYEKAQFPNYPPPDAQGYPPSVDVSRRLALLFAAYPDHCFSDRPHLDGEFVPTQKGKVSDTFDANAGACTAGAVRVQGNLPAAQGSGVHSGDDVVLTAVGPGSDAFHGHIDNTFVFHAIADALGLGARR